MSDHSFDVFLSHNGKDKPTVERIANRLRQTGITPWLDAWHLPGGGTWQAEIAAGINASRTFAYLVGPHGPGPWAEEELQVALNRSVRDRAFRVFLVLLPGLPEQFDATTLDAFLNMRTWVDLRGGFTDADALQPFINAIHGIPWGPPPALPLDNAKSPYLGLRHFEEADADRFFGREAEVQRLLEKLKGSRFLGIVGPSGSGKSSLARAGLIPALKRNGVPGSMDWRYETFRPGADPVGALAGALRALLPDRPVAQIFDELAGDARSLDLLATSVLRDRPGERLFLLIDQFEEVFTLCRDESAAAHFIDLLQTAATAHGGRCVIVLTLRADFYARCAAYPEFAALLSSHQFLVGPMDEKGLQAAITRPAELAGLSFEPGLIDTILNDLGDEPGSLPLLEHALFELWKLRHGALLTLKGYHHSGGVKGAIAETANRRFASFSREEQAIARRILLRLTQPGEETEDTRRRASLTELVHRPEEAATVTEVINKLVDARLLTASTESGTGDPANDEISQDATPQVDVAHEALIRNWQQLRDWLDEDRARLRIHRRLTEAAHDWTRHSLDPDLLYRGQRLTEAESLALTAPDLLNQEEAAFVAASAAAREWEAALAAERAAAKERQRRQIVAGLAAFSLVALVLAGLALLQWRNADYQTTIAQHNEYTAIAAVGTAESETNRANNQVILAAAAASTADAEGARAATEAAVARTAQGREAAAANTAEAERHAAETARVEAEDQRNLAIARQADALAAQADAEHQRNVALSRQITSMHNLDGAVDAQLLIAAEALRRDPESFAAEGNLVTLLAHHPTRAMVASTFQAAINPVAVSFDGRTIAAIDDTGASVSLWEIQDREIGEKRVLHPGAVAGTDSVLSTLTFTADDRALVFGWVNGEVTFWDLDTDQAIGPRWRMPESVISLAASPDGQHLAAGGGGTIRVWNLAAQWEVGPAIEVGGTLGPTTLTFSPDGSLLASAGLELSLGMWHVGDLSPLDGPMLSRSPLAVSVAFAPDGRSVMIGSMEGTIHRWRLSDQTVVQTLVSGLTSAQEAATPTADASLAAPIGMAFRADGRALVVGYMVPRVGQDGDQGSIDSEIGIWRFFSGPPVETLLGAFGGPIFSVHTARDSEIFVSTGIGQANVWRDLPDGRDAAIKVCTKSAVAGAISPDGGSLVIGCSDGTLQRWDVPTMTPLSDPVPAHEGGVYTLAYSPDGLELVSGGHDGVMRVWDPLTLSQRNEVAMSTEAVVRSLSYSTDGRFFAAADSAGQILVWQTGKQSLVLQRQEASEIASAALSPDGSYLIIGYSNGLMMDVSIEPDAAAFTISASDEFNRIWDLQVDPAREIVAVGNDSGAVRFFKTNDLSRSLGETSDQGGAIYSLAFSPDGTLLAAAGYDDVLRVWSAGQTTPYGAAYGAAIGDPESPTSIYWLGYLPNGKEIVVAREDGTVRFYNFDRDDLILRACRIANRDFTADEWRLYLGDEIPYEATCTPYLAPASAATPVPATSAATPIELRTRPWN